MKGFQAEQGHDLCFERFPQLLCEEWIVDTRHKSVVGHYTDGVVNDGGDSGSGKKQVGWGTGVSRGGGKKMMEDLKMILSISVGDGVYGEGKPGVRSQVLGKSTRVLFWTYCFQDTFETL